LGDLVIRTSQGKTITYKLGDDEKYEPKCMVDIEKIKENSLGFREETYKHLALNIRNKIRDLILGEIHRQHRFIEFDKIKMIFKDVDEKILMYALKISIYPNVIIDNISLIPHKNGIHIIDIIEDVPLKISLEKGIEEVKEDVFEIDKDFYEKMEKIRNDNYNNAIIGLYLGLDEKTFKIMIDKIFKEKKLDKVDSFIETCFYKEGVLISSKEIQGVSADKYVGFVNIFNEVFEPLLYNPNGNHKNLTIKQLDQLKKNRRLVQKPLDLKNEKLPFGMVLPKFVDKDKSNKINVFKILTAGVLAGEKTGMVCQSFKKEQHSQIFKDLGLKDEKNNKDSYCFKIAVDLLKKNRMLILPEYKPIKV